MLSVALAILGLGLIWLGFWGAGIKDRAWASLAAPVGFVLFVTGLIRSLVPGFFPF